MSDEAQQLPPGDVAQDPNAVAPSAVAQSADVTPLSAPPASNDAGASPIAASSVETVKFTAEDPERLKALIAADTQTFEQRVEERFLALEQALMGLPHSIHTVMSRGSTSAEEFGAAVIAHLFGKK
jgi:hypothetical protein